MIAGPSAGIVIMVRDPFAGSSKTRLVPRLGADGAALLSEAMVLDTLDLVRGLWTHRSGGGATADDTTSAARETAPPTTAPLNTAPPLDSLRDTDPLTGFATITGFVAVDHPDAGPFFSTHAPDMAQLLQRGTSLATRLAGAMCDVSSLGFDVVVALGGDCPHMGSAPLVAALETLRRDQVDLVFGPATDGGYYLIGWTTPHPEVVVPVTMSTPQVLDDSLALASAAGLRHTLLDLSYDLDEPADLDRFSADSHALHAAPRTSARLAAAGP